MECDDKKIDGEIYQGNDTDSFGRHFIQVNRPNGLDEDVIITKCVFQCGPLVHEEPNPTFPYYIDFSSSETKQLDRINECHLDCYDELGKHTTLEGTLTIKAKKQVVSDTPKEEPKPPCECNNKQTKTSGGRKRYD